MGSGVLGVQRVRPRDDVVSEPKEAPKPLWAVALDEMRSYDGGLRDQPVTLTPKEALAFVEHYLDTSARLAEAERERDRLRETVDATVAQWDEWMAERDAVATELDRYGLPREEKVAGLLRHIYNNRDAAFGGMKLACDGWQEHARL